MIGSMFPSWPGEVWAKTFRFLLQIGIPHMVQHEVTDLMNAIAPALVVVCLVLFMNEKKEGNYTIPNLV